MLFPTYTVACRCRDFIKEKSDGPTINVRIVQLSTPRTDKESVQAKISAVFLPESQFPVAKQYWQHTGEGVSSRLAEFFYDHFKNTCEHSAALSYKDFHRRSPPTNAASSSPSLNGQSEGKDQSVFLEERFGRNLDLSLASTAKTALRRRIAGKIVEAGQFGSHGKVESLSEHDVYLYPTGMATIFNAHRALRAVRGNTMKSVCYGFPYTDTLKILQKWGPGCHFFGNGDKADLDQLTQLLESGERILALFCEFPSNPLLKTPDLVTLRKLADKYDFAIVVDETVGNFVNVHVLPYADIVVSSLTKVFSGDCNVMGGSLVLNPNRRFYEQLKNYFEEDYEDFFWAEDAIYLERNSRDFAERNDKINQNAEAVTELLRESPYIKQVYYPKFSDSRQFFDHCKDVKGGYGGLFSVLFHDPAHARAFFDKLDIAKGPSLGTNFTLACPYTVIAHYLELDYVKTFGVDTNLVRISVGLEDKDDLLNRFQNGLDAAVRSVQG
jgi:cystathionine gamma-synthase